MGKKVFIIDDEPDILKVLEIRLKSSGYEVRSAKNAKEALEILNGYKPDIILLDYYLPDINGADLLKEIKKISSVASVPVIFVSASSESIEAVTRESGASDFIVKPMEIDELKSKIDKYAA